MSWRGELILMVINVSAESCRITGMSVKSAITPWDWIEVNYLHGSWTATPAIRVCGTLPRSPPFSPGYIRSNPEWRSPRGHSRSLWLEQIDGSCQEVLMMGGGQHGDLFGGTLGLASLGGWGDKTLQLMPLLIHSFTSFTGKNWNSLSFSWISYFL